MKVSLPKRPKKAHRVRPKLLLGDGIPRPLHGVNPRTIRGKTWWDRERKKAYAYNNHHCAACGVFRRDAKILQRLEAHEIYSINYRTKRMTFVGIVALCHCCHAVIHAGRTAQVYFKGTISATKLYTIVDHGEKHFKKYRLDLPKGFRYLQLVADEYSSAEIFDIIQSEYNDIVVPSASWSQWRLEFNGKLYPPLYKTHTDWEEHYGR